MNIEIRAPSMPVLVASLFIAFIALIGAFFTIPFISPVAFWISFLAYVVLALGTVVKPG